MNDARYRIMLDLDELPKNWYNILSDLPRQLDPPLNPVTKEPIRPEDLMALFPKELVKQEVSDQQYIRIPDEILEGYVFNGRPTPTQRAFRLEKYLKTPAKIFFKREDVSPTGSHKVNTALAQAYYAAKENLQRLTTETGAGQWGSALAYGANLFGIKTTIYMTRSSYIQKPYRRVLMELFNATVYPSPSDKTKTGKKFLEIDKNHPGSLGIAISEAIEDAITSNDAKYALGSVLNFVLLHQTIIGQEAKLQMQKIDLYPDIIIGCVGGGSNFGGLTLPFIHDRLKGIQKDTRFVAVEPESVPSLTKGKYIYDYGDTGKMTPLLKMYSVGYDYQPPPIHAGGLRYHGSAPIISLLKDEGIIESVTYKQVDVFKAAALFAKIEGLVPAPETAHAVKVAIDEALKAKERDEETVILFNFSGHGYFDLSAYDDFMKNKLINA